MATLSSIAALLLYIALAAVPSSPKHVIVQLSPAQRMVFAKPAEGWWLKPDDLGNPVFWKAGNAKLLVRGESSNNVEEVVLLNSFTLSVKQDWSKAAVIPSKIPEKIEVRTTPKKNGLAVTILRPDKKSEECSIEWY